MKKLTKTLGTAFVAVGLLCVMSATLVAQDLQQGMGRNMPTFESFDLNKDGFLTENELNEARANRMQKKAEDGRMLRNSANQSEFSEIDLDKDGKVTKEEFISHQAKRR